MTDPHTTQQRTTRLLTLALLAIVTGGTFLGVSTFVTANLSFTLGTERIVLPTITLFDLPAVDIAFSPPPTSGDVALSTWLATQIESLLIGVFLILHALGGLLTAIGVLTILSTVSVVGR